MALLPPFEPEDAIEGVWFEAKLRNHRAECCDCGLVHSFNFRIRKVGGRFRLYIQPFRAPAETRTARRRAAAKAARGRKAKR